MSDADTASHRHFLADECTFTNTVRLMRGHGCEVICIQEWGMAGASDAAVYQRVKEDEAVLVTTPNVASDRRKRSLQSAHHVFLG
ncbi:DUF5615 family PIN-like protein [Salinibacter sp.]|uniref:DUF5615 family PIN-like protein n=1 Tax=Salinibacter sp. TaxID=2065818 RepID=UPI003D6DBE19